MYNEIKLSCVINILKHDKEVFLKLRLSMCIAVWLSIQTQSCVIILIRLLCNLYALLKFPIQVSV